MNFSSPIFFLVINLFSISGYIVKKVVKNQHLSNFKGRSDWLPPRFEATEFYCPEDNGAKCSSTPDKCPKECKDSSGKDTANLACLKACLPWQKCFGNLYKPGCLENARACQSLVTAPIGDTAKLNAAKIACVPGNYDSDACQQACLPGLRCIFDDVSGLKANIPCTEWVKACKPALPAIAPCAACGHDQPADFSCLSACVPYIYCIGEGCENKKAAPCKALTGFPIYTTPSRLHTARTACRSNPKGQSCIKACFAGIKCVIDSFAGKEVMRECHEWVSVCKKAFPATSSCPAADALNYCPSADAKCPQTCKDSVGNDKIDLACLKACLPWQKCFGNPGKDGCRYNALACQPLVQIEVGDEAKINIAKAACVKGKYDSDACLQACLPSLKCIFSALAGLGTSDATCPEWERVCAPAVPSIDPCVACDAHAIPDFSCLHACIPYIHCIGKGCASSKATPCKALASAETSKVERRIEKAKLLCTANPMSGSCIKECLLGIKCVIDNFAGKTSLHECIGWVSSCKATFATFAPTTTTPTTTAPTTTTKTTKARTVPTTTPTTTTKTTSTTKATTAKKTTAKRTTTTTDCPDTTHDIMSGTLSYKINMIAIIMAGVHVFYIGL